MPTYIIAEAGSNWRVGEPRRDFKMATKLIDVAKKAGADAVKFQTYKPETVYVENAGKSNYLEEAGVRGDITDIFQDLSMPYEMIPRLAEYCKKSEIDFMSTPFSVADAEAIDPFVCTHKIASYEITHAPLIEWLAKTGKHLVMSTGGASGDDIRWAIDCFNNSGGSRLTLMQCTAKYPAPISTLNLNSIVYLKKKFKVDVGLSDHSRDPLIGPVGAVALGATIIEKHYTLHNDLPGPDHSFAVCPNELEAMISSIRKMETALGNYCKIVQKEEKELRSFAQRALQATSDIKAGDKLVFGGNFDVLRPGCQLRGIHPKFLSVIDGRKARKHIPKGQGIFQEDFE